MNNSNKKILIIASVVAGVLIVALLVYYFIFVNGSFEDTNTNSNNSLTNTIDTSKDNPSYQSEITNKIVAGNLVDSKVNERITSKIQGSVDLLENVNVSNVRVYQSNSSITPDMKNQESTYNGGAGVNNQKEASNGSDSTPAASSNDSNSVNVVLDLSINPDSKDANEINKEMETTSNYLADTYAKEMPEISVLIINYYVNKSDSISAEFTYMRSGNNLFLQEFTVS